MKIRKIEFDKHPILGDLKLDFTNQDGKVVSTIIIAGENGTGKSLLLDIIFKFSRMTPEDKKSNEKIYFEIEISDSEFEILSTSEDYKHHFEQPIKDNILKINIDYSIKNNWNQIKIAVEKENGHIENINGGLFAQKDTKKILKTIFSDVEINFTPKQITTVTSKNIDTDNFQSERSNTNLSTDITQLLIDIQSVDALEFTEWARQNPGQVVDQDKIDVRTKRFTTAFEYMFPTKKYSRIETISNRKEVIFEEHGKEMGISKLSSGEKQIVFRGSFLLKDKKSSKGALVLIDEPEISLHPTWQLKILTFFKKLFTDEKRQTSQLIVATHSPFIIHNANRYDDKVIVLQKTKCGNISVSDSPEFPTWSNEKKVSAAFNITQLLKPNLINVFVEGETDEKYFKKALELYDYDATDIDFKWIGRINNSGNAENTGDSALNQAAKFFYANEDMIIGKVVLLYDNDTNKQEAINDNFEIRVMSRYPNSSYEIGIENLLDIPDDFYESQFYKETVKKDKYGAESIIRELDKKRLCCYICDELASDQQKVVLAKIKVEIDKMIG